MKNLILTVVLAFSLNAVSSNDKNPFQNEDKYCAKLKDGKVIVVHEGSPIAADVILSNGTKIKADGSLIKPDGTQIILKEGECIDKNGAMPSN